MDSSAKKIKENCSLFFNGLDQFSRAKMREIEFVFTLEQNAAGFYFFTGSINQ